MFKKKIFKILIVIIFIPINGWSWSFFYGRELEKKEPVTVYKIDKTDRKLVFLQLDVTEIEEQKENNEEEDFEVKREKEKKRKQEETLSKESTNFSIKKKKNTPSIENLMRRQFGEDLLRSLYLKFKGIPQITVSTNDLITSWSKDVQSYSVKIYSNYVVEEPDSWVDKDTREHRKKDREEAEKRKKLFQTKEENQKSEDETKVKDQLEETNEDLSEEKKKQKQEEVSKLKNKKLEDFTSEEMDYLSENVENLEKWKRKNFSNQTPVHEIAYKRDKWGETSFFFFKKGVEYVDARLPNFDESMLKKDDKIQEILIWDKDERTGKLEKVIYRETNRYKRNLKVQNSAIKVVRKMMLPQVIKHLRESERADFAVHAKLSSGKKRGQTKIQVYLIRTASGEMELIYKNTFFISDLQKHVDQASSNLLASLQGVPLIKDIQFISDQKDAHVYLDDAYIGKTPLKINYPAGIYKFHFWKDNHDWDPSDTFRLNSDKLMLDYVPSEDAKDKLAHTNLWLCIDSRVSKDLVYLSFKEKEEVKKSGYVYVQSYNPVPQSKIFLDNFLVGIFEKNVMFSAQRGERILSFVPPGYRSIDGIVPVYSDFVSVVNVKYLPTPNYEQIEQRADMYKISSRVLALSGGFSFLLWFTSFLLANQSWDKEMLLKNIYTKKSIDTPSPAAQMYQKYYDTFSTIQQASLYSSLSLFSLGVFFKILEIKTRVTPVYNPNRQNKNFKIRYVPVNKFTFIPKK